MTAFDATAPSSPTLSAAARRFLEAPRFAIVATLNPDGSPLQAVVWYRLEGDAIVFNSRVGRRWPDNLQRDRRVSITVADGYRYIDLRGEVEVDEDPQRGQAVIADLTRRYQPDREAVAAQIAGFASQRRVTFRLRPSKVFERLSGD
ncbi:MAG: TIGR03618 family F420-dependent PPOX class oxidoreductase [Candidatus Limnocylindrales bacterium]|jgi:PPOX class probable F420-dependent enzyme